MRNGATPDNGRENRDRREDGSRIDPSLKGMEHQAFAHILAETTEALDSNELPYALIGGIASRGFGRPRWTHDIDILVKPEHAELVLEALAERGFRTERTDASWIFKGFKQDVMVDVIFRSAGGFYLDQEMLDRAVRSEFLGLMVRFVSPEDLLIMKAVVHDEAGPRHWHDALGIIACGRLDWEYLERRASRAPRRILSLLLYAQSLDMSVPNRVIRSLFERVYES